MEAFKKRREEISRIRGERELETTREVEERLRTFEEKQRRSKALNDELLKLRAEEAHRKNQSVCERINRFQLEKEEKEQAEIQRLENSLNKEDERLRELSRIANKMWKQKIKNASNHTRLTSFNKQQEEKLISYDCLVQLISLKNRELIERMKRSEELIENYKSEQNHEIRLRQELRRLREEDMRKIKEREKRLEVIREHWLV